MNAELQTVKKTRADHYRDMVAIRLAVPEAGPQIALILKENGIDVFDGDFKAVSANWLIATVEDEVIGCILVLPAVPFSAAEFLLVKPSAPFKLRAIAIRKLLLQAQATAYACGATHLVVMVDGKNQKFYDVAIKDGFQAVSPHMAMLKRLK